MNANDQGERPTNNETVADVLENLTVQLADQSKVFKEGDPSNAGSDS